MDVAKKIIKEEVTEEQIGESAVAEFVDISSDSDFSDSNTTDDDDSSSMDDGESAEPSRKKPKTEVILPVGFLDPLPPHERATFAKWRSSSIHSTSTTAVASADSNTTSIHPPLPVAFPPVPVINNCKQFWKAGDYEAINFSDSASRTVGMDHLRVHPKFLHSNATSHKWALGAFAELLDNALDEVCNGATYVHIDMLQNKKDNNKMLLVEDNGGGMVPDTMRHCMSLGYSVKSKLVNTIGQYGNGFKTSTMRLGADVIVFSRCRGVDGRSSTQSVGMLSYTFLRRTGKEDIVVPMIDYEKSGGCWNIMTRSTPDDWRRNLETILMWSPYASEKELHQEFDLLKDQGTRIIIYNLWEDDQGGLELDFDTDEHDIQIRGANRDEKKIDSAQTYPNSRHFLTYRHSLRSYAAILYLRIPPDFRIILRGRDVEHHNIVNDMMHKKELTYKPTAIPDAATKDQNMVADVTIGFVKDAKFHIDVQGFNVYHKNRLIRPFWRVWNAAGSNGRGVIGVLEANFIEPAHDKQGFEKTIVLSRLEARLVVMQKNYWSANCHLIGYARRQPKRSVSPEKELLPSTKVKSSLHQILNRHDSGYVKYMSTATKNRDIGSPAEDGSEKELGIVSVPPSQRNYHRKLASSGISQEQNGQRLHVEVARGKSDAQAHDDSNARIATLKEENLQLKKRVEKIEGLKVVNLLRDLQYERDRVLSIENKHQQALQRIEEMDKEHTSLIEIFEEERRRRDMEEESLRMRLKDASDTIEELVKKVKLLESKPTFSCKIER